MANNHVRLRGNDDEGNEILLEEVAADTQTGFNGTRSGEWNVSFLKDALGGYPLICCPKTEANRKSAGAKPWYLKRSLIAYPVVCMVIAILFFSLVLALGIMKPWPHNERRFIRIFAENAKTLTSIAFGSCANQAYPQPFWDTIATEFHPDIFIFAGDNIYGDYAGKEWAAACPTGECSNLKQAYAELEKKPSFNGFRSKFPILPVWDDHDFGRNAADGTFEYKKESQTIFKHYFEIDRASNKVDQRKERDGVYGSYHFGRGNRRVSIIVLDLRYFKSPWVKRDPKKSYLTKGEYVPSIDSSKTILGETQWLWLEEELKREAEVCVIVSSFQMISIASGWELWGLFPKERDRIFKLLKESKCKVSLVASGDRHVGGIYKTESIIEVTSSSLTHTMQYVTEPDNLRIGSLVEVNNFGGIVFDWDSHMVIVNLMETDGKTAGNVIKSINASFG